MAPAVAEMLQRLRHPLRVREVGGARAQQRHDVAVRAAGVGQRGRCGHVFSAVAAVVHEDALPLCLCGTTGQRWTRAEARGKDERP
eukprot:scaffold17499_cov71-Phaeocystis_antarctica.AAC.2